MPVAKGRTDVFGCAGFFVTGRTRYDQVLDAAYYLLFEGKVKFYVFAFVVLEEIDGRVELFRVLVFLWFDTVSKEG